MQLIYTGIKKSLHKRGVPMDQKIFNSLPMLFFIYNKDGVFVDVLGGSENERIVNARKNIGLNVAEVFEDSMANEILDKFNQVIEFKIPINFTFTLSINNFRDKNHSNLLNEEQWFEVILTPILDKNGDVDRIFWAQFSIQPYIEKLELLEKERKEFKQMAMKDELTGLYNRRYLYKKLQDKLDCVKNNKNVNKSILSINIDNLTSINKNFGLFEGDKVIENLTKELLDKFRDIGICTRFREDNFIVILGDSSIVTSEVIAEEFRKTIEAKESKEFPKFTISIGITEIRRSDETIDEVIERVEEALFYAKKSGKNRCYSTLL